MEDFGPEYAEYLKGKKNLKPNIILYRKKSGVNFWIDKRNGKVYQQDGNRYFASGVTDKEFLKKKGIKPKATPTPKPQVPRSYGPPPEPEEIRGPDGRAPARKAMKKTARRNLSLTATDGRAPARKAVKKTARRNLPLNATAPKKKKVSTKVGSRAALYKKAKEIKDKKCKDLPISKYNKTQLYNYISRNV